jgi:hypothetical protein
LTRPGGDGPGTNEDDGLDHDILLRGVQHSNAECDADERMEALRVHFNTQFNSRDPPFSTFSADDIHEPSYAMARGPPIPSAASPISPHSTLVSSGSNTVGLATPALHRLSLLSSTPEPDLNHQGSPISNEDS